MILKKSVKIAVLLILLIVIGAAAVQGKKYYESRYVGTDYYAKVTEEQSVEPETLLDDSGKEMGKGMSYQLKAFNEKGEERLAEFTIVSDSSDGLLKPGTYLKLSISEQIVVKHEMISEDGVPDIVRQRIQ